MKTRLSRSESFYFCNTLLTLNSVKQRKLFEPTPRLERWMLYFALPNPDLEIQLFYSKHADLFGMLVLCGMPLGRRVLILCEQEELKGDAGAM